jgi:hypothetical protein
MDEQVTKVVERLKARITVAEATGRRETSAQRKVYWTGVADGLKTALRMIRRAQRPQGKR